MTLLVALAYLSTFAAGLIIGAGGLFLWAWRRGVMQSVDLLNNQRERRVARDRHGRRLSVVPNCKGGKA